MSTAVRVLLVVLFLIVLFFTCLRELALNTLIFDHFFNP